MSAIDVYPEFAVAVAASAAQHQRRLTDVRQLALGRVVSEQAVAAHFEQVFLWEEVPPPCRDLLVWAVVKVAGSPAFHRLDFPRDRLESLVAQSEGEPAAGLQAFEEHLKAVWDRWHDPKGHRSKRKRLLEASKLLLLGGVDAVMGNNTVGFEIGRVLATRLLAWASM